MKNKYWAEVHIVANQSLNEIKQSNFRIFQNGGGAEKKKDSTTCIVLHCTLYHVNTIL